MAVLSKNKYPQSAFEKFVLHLHPHRIDQRALQFSRTFGLGGINALLFVLLVFTGLLLRFSYVPTATEAYTSVVRLQQQTLLGGFIRNVHHISAVLMVVVSFLHLLRVFYAQAIYEKRAQNWIFGLVLFLLVVASNFTGYLLPWDQLAYWAVTVITHMVEYIPLLGPPLADWVRRGDSVNGHTILNFYTLHTGILPIAFLVIMSFHFWLVRKAGGVALPQTENSEKVNVLPHLVVREILALFVVLAFIFLLAVFYDAPLLIQANPLESPNPAKAPWYFLGAQELLLHLHPVFAAFIIPLCLTLFFFSLPYWGRIKVHSGVWFNSAQGRKSTVATIGFSGIFTLVLIGLLEYALHVETWMPGLPGWLTSGMIPLLLYMVPTGLFVQWIVHKKGKRSRVEVLQVIVTGILTSYLVMTCVSWFLRGEGMQLIF